MSHHVNRSLAGAGFAAAGLLVGCGPASPLEPETRAPRNSSHALEVAPGVVVSTAAYQISGPDDFSSAGNVPVGASATVAFSLPGIPVGTGYHVALHALASDGLTTCTGTTPFDVMAPGPVALSVLLTCGVPTGTVNVTATINVCPTVDTLDASPAEARLGGRMFLSAGAHDTDDGPSPITYRWRANGVPLARTQPDLRFTCTSPGNFALSVSALDGDPRCDQALIANLTCSP